MLQENINTMIVLARKYNDIYYAIASEEWIKYDKHILLIVPNRSPAQSFPYINFFDECVIIPPDKNISTRNFLKYILKIKKIMQHIRGDVIFMSNPEMLINRIIFKLSGSKEIIFLEDGLMNYYNFHSSNGGLKKIVEYFFSVSNKTYLNKISTTYLSNPNKARYYFGEKKQIKISSNIKIDKTLPNLSGKKILIAQNVLNVRECSKGQQDEFFNSIINKYNIDYYVPRTYDYQEDIRGCEILNLNNKGITLEILASKFNMEIYGFTTTLLFSLKMINPHTVSHQIISEKTKHLTTPQIIKENLDYIENFDINIV